jgi:hypothetical protein
VVGSVPRSHFEVPVSHSVTCPILIFSRLTEKFNDYFGSLNAVHYVLSSIILGILNHQTLQVSNCINSSTIF